MRPFPIGDSPLSCMQHPYSESTNRASYVDPICGGGRYNNSHGVEAKRRETTNPRRRRIYSNAKRRRNVSIMTKQSAETAKCQNRGLYSITKPRRRLKLYCEIMTATQQRVDKRSAETAKSRDGGVYTLLFKTAQEMYTQLGDLQSFCSIDGARHLGWRKSHDALYNPTQRDTHFVLIFSRLTFLRCRQNKSTNRASFVDTICGGGSDNGVNQN
jgi:hypothetical protein